jgi:putative endonuclease
MANWKQELGKWGEDLAAAFLEKNGYTLIKRNYHTPYGEIDIIASEEDQGETYLIFVEVKTRSSDQFGYPENGVTRRKLDHLMAAIDRFFQENPNLDYSWQIDVIAIRKNRQHPKPEILHYKNVFR